MFTTALLACTLVAPVWAEDKVMEGDKTFLIKFVKMKEWKASHFGCGRRYHQTIPGKPGA